MNLNPHLENIMNRFEQLIQAAPDAPELTPEQQAAEQAAKRTQDRDRRIAGALGRHTGWEARYAQAVKTAPHGAEWLAAYESAQQVVRSNGILVLYGGRGGGKTRMAAELAVMVGSSRYRTAMRFFLDVRATFKRNSDRSELEVIDELAKAELLILDEIQERGETAFEDRLLTHVIDARYAAMRPTIIIANLTKGAIVDALGPSICDRARENGKSIEFSWESFRSK
jgi:DNA replication protein DnaC